MSINGSVGGSHLQRDSFAGDSSLLSNLGAVAAASVQLTQETLSQNYKLSIVAGTTTRVLPQMPVGAEVSFEVALPAPAVPGTPDAFLQIQELDNTGTARALTRRRATGALAQFAAVTPCVLVASAATGAMLLANSFFLDSTATGRLGSVGLGTVRITYRKLTANTASLADGWALTYFGQIGYDTT